MLLFSSRVAMVHVTGRSQGVRAWERAGVVVRLTDKDRSVRSWLKIFHLAAKTATSFLVPSNARNPQWQLLDVFGFGGWIEVW